MDFNVILPLLINIAGKIREDFADKQITVDELIDVIKMVVDELGFGDFVILDLTKNKSEKSNVE